MSAVLELFEDIERYASVGDWNGCLSACNTAITECTEHKPIVQKCQLICLFKQGSFQQALDLLKNMGGDLTFEKAYALYGLKRYQEAITCCGEDFKSRLLKAQIYYEMEDYVLAMKEYEWLLKAKEFEKYNESNVIAVEACLQFQQHAFKPRILETLGGEEDGDLLYNYGCLQLVNNNLEEAEQAFRLSEKKMNLEEDADAINARFQLAVISQLKGNLTAAEDQYQSTLKSCDGSNGMLAALVAINRLLLNEDGLSVDPLRRKLKKMCDKLKGTNVIQRMHLSYNQKILNLETGHEPDVRSCLKSAEGTKLQKLFEGLQMAWLVKQRKYGTALESLKGGDDEDVVSLKAKILAAQGSFLEAAEELKCIGKARWVPVVCDLYAKANDTSKLKNYVNQLLNGDQRKTQLISRISGGLSRLPAVKRDSELLNILQSSVELPRLTDLFGQMTVADVEHYLQSADKTQVRRHKAALGRERPKRKRKNKPPKSTDKPIDLERWIPLKERSYCKHARRRAKHAMGKRTTQGTAEATEGEQWLGDKTALTMGTSMQESATALKKPSGLAKAATRPKRKKRDKW